MKLIWVISVFAIFEADTQSAGPLMKTIAVMEYPLITYSGLTPNQILDKNVNRYIETIKELKEKYHIMLVVFPEGTLDNVRQGNDLPLYGTTITFHENPCTTHSHKYPKYFQKLACTAAKYRVTVILNLIEKESLRFYSSDVVIGSDGVISYSIRKEHRLGDGFLDRKPIALAIPSVFMFQLLAFIDNTVTSVTTFSTTSVLTGFLFSHEKMIAPEYRNYLVCSNWISELPFLSSLQVHQMWAQEYNITMFFSGASKPDLGQGGTGIYHAAGVPILMDISASGSTKTYVYNFTHEELPGALVTPRIDKSIDQLGKEMDAFHMNVDPNLNRYTSIVLDETHASSSIELCHNKTKNNTFCCQFSIKLSINKTSTSKNRYTYHLVAYRGLKEYFKIFEPGGIEICGVIACLNKSVTSCGQRFSKYDQIHWPTTFEKLVVKASFGLPRKEGLYFSSQFPSSLLSSLRPLHSFATNWTKQVVNKQLERRFALNEPQNRILVFAIFGRNFTLVDSSPHEDCPNLFYLLFANYCILQLSKYIS